MKHTPGTWVSELVGDSGGEHPEYVYEVLAAGGHFRVAEHLTEADARLIAAAPELLDALKRLVDKDLAYFDGSVMNHCISMRDVDLAREAIQRATGEA
jgi:hypothetical protein